MINQRNELTKKNEEEKKHRSSQAKNKNINKKSETKCYFFSRFKCESEKGDEINEEKKCFKCNLQEPTKLVDITWQVRIVCLCLCESHHCIFTHQTNQFHFAGKLFPFIS